jgi:hypothetical protein
MEWNELMGMVMAMAMATAMLSDSRPNCDVGSGEHNLCDKENN